VVNINKGNRESQDSYGWVILGIFTLAQLIMSVGAYAWGPLAPFLSKELGLTNTQIGSLSSVLYLVSVIIATPSGFLVDRLGAKVMLVVCLGLMGISFGAMYGCNSYFLLAVLAGAAGLGYGILNQASVKGLMYWFTARFRGTALGVKQAGVTVGAAAGAILLPFLTRYFNWQVAVTLIGLLMLVMAVVAAFFYREKPPAKKEVTLTSTPAAEKPGQMRKVFKNPELLATVIVMPLLAGSQICISTFLIKYLQDTNATSVVIAETSLAVVMVAATVSRIGWGVMSDLFFKGNRVITMCLICFLALGGAVGINFLPGRAGTGLIFFYSIILGLSFLGFHGVLMALVGEIAGTALAGAVSGIVVTISWAGIVVLPVVFGSLVDHYGYFWGWLMVAGSALLGFISYFYTFLKQLKAK
jgi:MFS family permease